MDVVNKLVKKYRTRDPFELANFMNIIVLFEDLGTINGYYNYAFRQKFIHINQNLDKKLQKLVAAHELGHAILHPKSNTPFMKDNTFLLIDKMEIEANRFAINLLVSDEDIITNSAYTLQQLSVLFGYSEKFIKLKINTMKNI